MHNRGFCVGNSVTSGRTGSGSMALREAQKHCLVRDRKRGGRSIDRAICGEICSQSVTEGIFYQKKYPFFHILSVKHGVKRDLCELTSLSVL